MSVIQMLSNVLPVIAVASVLLVALVNLYLVIRRQFPIKVNCWFCNEFTKVSYDQRNSFICQSCQQYNGFSHDGDYNKLIPQQHDELLNSHLPAIKTTAKKSSNGLCRFCNNNQQLKIYQLANFVPLNENNYDAEVEHYERLLEKAYKLCPKCDNVLRKTINSQNKWLLGEKISRMQRKSISLLDLNKSTKSLTSKQKRQFLNAFIYYSIILVSLLLIINNVLRIDFSDKNIRQYSPIILQPTILTLKGLFNIYYEQVSTNEDLNDLKRYFDKTLVTSSVIFGTELRNKLETCKYFGDFISNIPIDVQDTKQDILLLLSGFFLQICTLLLRKHNIFATSSWIFLIAAPFLPGFNRYTVIYRILKIILAVVLIHKSIKSKNKTSIINLPKCEFKKRDYSISSQFDSTIQSDCSENSYTDLSSELSNSTSILDKSIKLESPILNMSKHSIKPPRRKMRNLADPAHNPLFGAPALLNNPLIKIKPKPINTTNSLLNGSMQNLQFGFNANSGVQNTSSLNNTQSSFKTALNVHNDLQNSLQNLNLGQKFTNNSISHSNNVFKRTTVLTPSKFRLNNSNSKKSSWVTDNWIKQNEGQFSRCSSQTSGFASNVDYPNGNSAFASLPNSPNSSICGDFDCSSIISEPVPPNPEKLDTGSFYSNRSMFSHNSTFHNNVPSTLPRNNIKKVFNNCGGLPVAGRLFKASVYENLRDIEQLNNIELD